MSTGAKILQTNNCGAIPAQGQCIEPKSDEQFDAEFAAILTKRTDKLNDNTIDLALRLKQALLFLNWSTTHVKEGWYEWQHEASKIAQELTMTRMAIDRESKAMIAAGKDVVTLFNSPDYLKAHATMKEMVDMLDRFSQLKRDGVMDAFADFILKVSCK